MAGTVEGEVSTEHDTTYVKNLKYAVELLEKENLIGLIEPINQYSVPKYYLNSYDKGRRKFYLYAVNVNYISSNFISISDKQISNF